MLSVKAPQRELIEKTRAILRKYSLNTVCEESLCPNMGECFFKKTATFLILGKVCTRACKYCHVATGKPQPPDPSEPVRLYHAIRELGLRHVVITSVDRDDLPDYGAGHFRRCVEFLKSKDESLKVEVLTPDFRGSEKSLEQVVLSHPDVLSHNIETVERVFSKVRPQGDYRRSLSVLSYYSESGVAPVKSGLMLGLGEDWEEIIKTMEDLRKAGVSMLVIGQYLQPSRTHYPVRRFYGEEEFSKLKAIAITMGFERVLSEPLARSSYHAEDML
ncbi:MAG: lipoyl synthase [Aquificaceae bacterium]|nr:lipoyl synthase [Aquificaceae bacterium]MCS7277406.1 lipoyl synthase [Aquificaceae bacterium]MDW8066840.1 lipoyl synthase [Aquificaceae bacterium]MDW8422981.1 lipoyl synthase [Aquificaceae bacterium]